MRGELVLLVAVLINSFGVVLMLHSGAGISAISSVPFAFSEVFTRISLGTWTYLFLCFHCYPPSLSSALSCQKNVFLFHRKVLLSCINVPQYFL